MNESGITGALRRSRLVVQVRHQYWKLRFHLLSRFAPSWHRSPGGFPVPPEPLRFLISGIRGYPEDEFLEMGRRCAKVVVQMLRRDGVEIASLGSVLDFGCGCGRTLRHFAKLERTRLHGTDYNPVLIRWCRPNLAFAEFGLNGLEPPLRYEDEAFDLVYAFSVFTHLPDRLQLSWMAELRRVLKSGGHLVFSTMPASMVSAHGEDAERRFRNDELVVINASDAGENVCAAFHPQAYVRAVLGRGFEVKGFDPGGVGQDVWLFRKQPSEAGAGAAFDARDASPNDDSLNAPV